MNAIGTPAPAGIAGEGRLAPDRRDWLRLVGGMMFGAGALVLLIRKASDWSDWAQFAALLIPAAVLFAIAFVSRARWGMQGWQAAFLVFGTLLLLGALLQLVNAANGNPRASLNLAWTFGVAAAVAVVTSLALRAPFQMLLGALLLVAWLALWDKILTNPSGDTVRWLLIVLAAIFLGAAFVLARARRPQASDLITVAGLAAVLAAALSFAGRGRGCSSSGGLAHGRRAQAWAGLERLPPRRLAAADRLRVTVSHARAGVRGGGRTRRVHPAHGSRPRQPAQRRRGRRGRRAGR